MNEEKIMIDNFNELGLDNLILQSIKNMGFVKPTPIQSQVIPHILNKQGDLIAMAQTGTGKTAAFGLPLLESTEKYSHLTQTLILCPTRELCMQISKDLSNYAALIPEIDVAAVYGGAEYDRQVKMLKKGAQFVVGTPGRTLDLIKKKVLKVQHIKWLVLDEADEMLNMGFKEDLDAILEKTPAEKRTLLFSATMSKEIQKIAESYMDNHETISAGAKNIGATNVSHEYYMTHAKNRFKALQRIVDLHPNIYSIVFCRTRRETKEVAEKLMQNGYNADALHGDLSQEQRTYVMSRFRQKGIQILVATDVAARGLDVDNLTHVINYNLPDEQEAYIHRSGRTGRAGKKGVSIAIVHTREKKRIEAIEKKAKIKFAYKKIPTGQEICEKQLFNLINKIEFVDVDESQINDFLPVVYKKLSWLSREDLIKRVVSVEFNRFLEYYRNTPDLNAKASKRGDSNFDDDYSSRNKRDRKRRNNNRSDSKGVDRRKSGKSYTRFFINLGILDDLTENKLNKLVKTTLRDHSIEIAKADLMKKFSFFEIESKHKKNVLSAFEALKNKPIKKQTAFYLGRRK